MSVASASGNVLSLCERLAAAARESTLSDLAVASSLAWSALESGAATARANLAHAAEADAVRTGDGELTRLLASGQAARARLLGTIAARSRRSAPAVPS